MTGTKPTAIVTGGARGIGAATAVRLAGEGHGVAVADLDLAGCGEVVEFIRSAGGVAMPVVVDVADEVSVADGVRQVAEELGPPSVLVNNAGILRDNLLFRMTLADWDDVMGVHLRGAFLMSREVQQHMVAGRFGRIINMSSVSALGNRGQANYAAAKAGLQGLTKTLSIELGKFGITVNAIAPGFIETDMTRATAARMNVEFDEFRDLLVAEIPVGRSGTADDVAAAVAFFASHEAGFVSGQVLYVAGGPTT
ncbi:3-oxoacyl-ACP reductase FabG [Nocardioides sp.]|uniref:3-oxoacyl-ACP reductase FabG n=1 Tax=Nocardioides sp. TaxID=35761 RepID=UPI003D0EBB9E